jgi:hypothetical protein
MEHLTENEQGDHGVLVTDAVVRTFATLDLIEHYARDSARCVRARKAVLWTCEDPDRTKKVTISTTRLFGNCVMVSIEGDTDSEVKCLRCLQAGRLHVGPKH